MALSTTDDERVCIAIWNAAEYLAKTGRQQRSLRDWTLALLTTAYPEYAARWDDLFVPDPQHPREIAFAIACVFPPFAVVQWRVECADRLLDVDEMIALRDAITQYHEQYWHEYDRFVASDDQPTCVAWRRIVP